MAAKPMTSEELLMFINSKVEERLEANRLALSERDALIQKLNDDRRRLQKQANDLLIKYKELKTSVDLFDWAIKRPDTKGFRAIPVNKAVQVNCSSCEHGLTKSVKIEPMSVNTLIESGIKREVISQTVAEMNGDSEEVKSSSVIKAEDNDADGDDDDDDIVILD